MIDRWADEHLQDFDRDGFLVVQEGFVDDATVERLRGRFERLFEGDYE